LFIGPVILAVTSTILNAWINEQPPLPQVEAMSNEEIANTPSARGLADTSGRQG
jgi:hypothetical protein